MQDPPFRMRKGQIPLILVVVGDGIAGGNFRIIVSITAIARASDI